MYLCLCVCARMRMCMYARTYLLDYSKVSRLLCFSLFADVSILSSVTGEKSSIENDLSSRDIIQRYH